MLLNNGAGFIFGDGLRCVGVNLRRLQVVVSSATGVSQTSVDLRTVHGNTISAGDTKYYQL